MSKKFIKDQLHGFKSETLKSLEFVVDDYNMPSNTDQQIRGVVLAGGKSTRLGMDKVKVKIGGKNLLKRSLALAGECCSQVVCVGRDVRPLGLDVPWLPDQISGIGPMGGIITALKILQSPCLVLACDQPNIDGSLIRHLINRRNQRDPGKCMTTFLQEHTGYIESLAAVYEPECLDLLVSACKRGCYKLSRAVPFERRCHIIYGPDQEHFFFNINFPRDLESVIEKD